MIVISLIVSNDNAIRLYVDSADSITPPLVEAAVNQVLLGLGAHNPVIIDKIYGDIKYLQFFGVGVIMMAIFTSTMFGGGIALIKDRENGIHEGYLVTPVKRSSIIFGIISSGTSGRLLPGLPFSGSIFYHRYRHPECPGFFAGSAGDPDRLHRGNQPCRLLCVPVLVPAGYSSVIAFFNLILFMTSGAFYPVIGMPGWLRWITVINPEYYGVHALRSIILKNQGFNVIGIDIIALLIFSTAMIILGIVTFRRTLE